MSILKKLSHTDLQSFYVQASPHTKIGRSNRQVIAKELDKRFEAMHKRNR